MGIKHNKDDWKEIKFTISKWVYLNKLKVFADENGLSIRGAIRFIINQFFKNT